MDTKVNYTTVGIFVIFLSAALIIAGIWIAKRGDVVAYRIYLLRMQEAVSGLNSKAPVRFNGVTVGYVKKISIDPSDSRIVDLLLKIDESAPVNESTTASLMTQGITGMTYIGLRVQDPHAPRLQKRPGQEYPEIKWTPSVLFQIDAAFREFNANVKIMTTAVKQLLNDQNQQAVQQTLKNLTTVTNTLATHSDDMKRVLHNSANASEQLPQVLKQLHQTLLTVNIGAKQLGVAGRSATTTFNSGQVTMQNINQQTLPALTESLNRLNTVLANLQQLTRQLQHNPGLLVRGKRPAKLGPGE